MPVKTFTTNEEWNVGIEARSDVGYRTLSYSGTLDGGTLQISTQIAEGDKIAIADGKLNATKLDDNGDMIRQMVFQSSGNVFVTLSDGGVAINAKVGVL